MNDDAFIGKILDYFNKVSCHQEDVTLDGLYCGSAFADFLSTLDLDFFDEKWHDEIVFIDRSSNDARMGAINSILSQLADFYIMKLSRHLGGSLRWKVEPTMVALRKDPGELIKIVIICIFAAGSNSSLMDRLNLVFNDDELQTLVEKLAEFNNDIPTVCDDDRRILMDLVRRNRKDTEALRENNYKLNTEIQRLQDEQTDADNEINRLQREKEDLAERCETFTSLAEQTNAAKKKVEADMTHSLNAERQIASLEEEVTTLKFKLKGMEKDLQEKTFRVARLQDENVEIVTNYQSLQTEMTRLKTQQARAAESKSESKEDHLMKIKMENYIKEVAKLRSQLTDIETLKGHAANLQMINDDLDRRLSDLVKHNHELIADNGRLQRRVYDLESSIPNSATGIGVFRNDSDVLSGMADVSLTSETPSLLEEMNVNAKMQAYEEQLSELEKENASLRAKLDNTERQRSNLLCVKEESDEQRRTSDEVMQAKLSSYQVMYNDAEARLHMLEKDHESLMQRSGDQLIEIERLKGELAMTSKTLKEKEQALKDYVELHIQTNEALGSTTIGDEAKLKLDFVEMKVKNDKLAQDLRAMTNQRDQLIQEQRLISTHWYQMVLERHGDAASRSAHPPPKQLFSDDNQSLPPRPPSVNSNPTEPTTFMRSASRRFQNFRLFKNNT